MTAEGWVLVIGAGSVSLTGIVAAIFSGLIALRQMPRQAAAVDAVHTLVNTNFSEQKDKIDALEAHILTLNATALARAEAQAAPPFAMPAPADAPAPPYDLRPAP